MTKEAESSGGGDPRKALRSHLARCVICLTTDPAAMCVVGDVLLEAAAVEMLVGTDATEKEPAMSGNERMLRESLLDHAVVCSHGCAIQGSKVVRVCPTGQAVQAKIDSLPKASLVREEGDDEIPF